MFDDDKIMTHLMSLPDGELMSDACARVVAEWHSPGNPGLTALSSSGAITDTVAGEIAGEMRPHLNRKAYRGSLDPDEELHLHSLEALLTYVTTVGERGPVAGWASLQL